MLDLLTRDARPSTVAHLLGKSIHTVKDVAHVAHHVLAVNRQRATVGLRSSQGGMKHRAVLGRVHMLAGKHRVATLLDMHRAGQIEQQFKRLLGDEVLGEVEMQLAHVVRKLGDAIGVFGKRLLEGEVCSNLFLMFNKRGPLRGLRCIDRSRNNRHMVLLLRAGLGLATKPMSRHSRPMRRCLLF